MPTYTASTLCMRSLLWYIKYYKVRHCSQRRLTIRRGGRWGDDNITIDNLIAAVACDDDDGHDVAVLTKRRAPPLSPLRPNHPQPPPPLSDSSTVVGVTRAGMGVTCAVGGAGGHYRARYGRGGRRREVAANRLDVQSTDDTATVRLPHIFVMII